MTAIEAKGRAEIKHIKELYEEIGKALETDDEIELNFSDTEKVDLSVVQVMIAAGRVAREQSKILRIRGAGERIRRQLSLCGIGPKGTSPAEDHGTGK